MNSSLIARLSLVARALFGALLLGAASSASAADPSVPDLLVKVNFALEWQDNSIPAELNAAFELGQLKTMKGYDAALRRGLVERLGATFARQGYTGKLGLIDDAPASAQGQSILVIDLERWAVAPSGRFDCHFKARYVSPEASADLGAVDYTDIKLERAGNAFRDHAVEKATDVALVQLHQQAVKAGVFAAKPAAH